MPKFKIPEEVIDMKRNTKMNKALNLLAGVARYMDTFRVEYLMVNSEVVAHYGENGLTIYDSKDTRKVSRCYDTLLLWDNYKSDRVSIYENVMNIQR